MRILILRIGGFGGTAGLAGYLRDEAITVIVDVTHPFAAAISANAAEAAAQAGLPLLALRRPPWPTDQSWQTVPDIIAVRSTPARCRPGSPGRPARRWRTPCSGRYLADTGGCPDSVGLSVWGTAAMRTSGDDVPRCSRCSACGRCGMRRPVACPRSSRSR